jgi:hypothetical protein
MTKVLITIDVEDPYNPVKMNRIWGKVGNVYYGLPKIVEILNAYDFKATFFVDVYESKMHGDDKIQEVLKFLSDAGQDIQLHTHPGSAGKWGKGGLAGRPLEEQIEIIKWGKEFIEDSIGKKVVAHRAGSYKADNDTLAALKHNNINFDASLFYKSKNCKIDTGGTTYNDTFLINDIFEFPVTTIKVNSIFFRNILLKTDIEQEEKFLLQSLNLLKKLDYRYVTFFMHSFSLMINYSKAPMANVKNIEKLHKVLQAINKLKLDVVTFGELNPSSVESGKVQDIPTLNLSLRESVDKIIDRLGTEIRYQMNKKWINEVKETYGF